MPQRVLIVFVAPAFLLLGLSPTMVRRLVRRILRPVA